MDEFFTRMSGWQPRSLAIVDVTGDPERELTFEEARRLNCVASHLAMTPSDYVAGRVPRYAAVEIKYNGIGMCVTAQPGGSVTATTQEGVPMHCADHLLADFEDMAAVLGEPTFFQAEYVVPDAAGKEDLGRTAGALNSGQPTGSAFVYDAVPLTVWRGELQSSSFFVRRRFLAEAHAISRPALVRLAGHAQGFDAEGIELAAGIAWQDGWEGLVVKDLEAPFVRRRDPSQMKVKRKQSDDLPIRSVMTDGAGGVMKIICDRAGQPIAVPHGFAAFRDRPDEFRLGRIVEIAHEGVTKGGYLLSPRFVRFRDDKGAR